MYVVSEYGLIQRASDFPADAGTFSRLLLPDSVFEPLKRFVTDGEGETGMQYGFQKGREFIRLKNYVGLLETPDGTQIEILPKVLPPSDPGDGGADALQEATCRGRLALLRMLRHSPQTPFRRAGTASLGARPLPLWEVFIGLFLDEITTLVTQGLQKSYVTREESERFLKGKLQVPRQLRENFLHAERLAVAFDEFTADIPQNRLLKSALRFVGRRARSSAGQNRIRQLLFTLEEVPFSENVKADLRAVRTTNRLYSRYESALRWAEVLLSGQSFGPTSGKQLTLALLFPMERLFETYVAAGFCRYVAEGEVLLQESTQHLIADHGGEQRFRLRPDIILRRSDRVTVLDTKWKRIDATDIAGNYGIEQADLYQLFAYGKKYGASEVVLIYPAGETFREPLDVFGYDETMRLRVVPFDVLRRLEEEVLKITAHSDAA